MSPRCHCQRAMNATGNGRRPHPAREVAAMIVPGTFLVLMPKCPLCFAAYAALGTGFTLSCSSAHLLMRSLTALCVTLIACCLVRGLARFLLHQNSVRPPSTNTHP